MTETRSNENGIWEFVVKPSEIIFLVVFMMGELRGKSMDKNTYTIVSKFECCGMTMIIVRIKEKAACVMTEKEYNRIIEDERKFEKGKLKRLK